MIRDIIFRNFLQKLLSVALATVIWMAIHHGIANDVAVTQPLIGRLASEDFIQIPVSTVREASDRRQFRITPRDVVVTAAGTQRDLERAAGRDIKVYVDLTDLRSGQTARLPLRAVAPNGVTVTKITPPEVVVEEETTNSQH